MLKNLFIENFEGYKKVNLNFSAGVNILTGVSDSGKSSVYRAIEWVTMNQPAGEDFISHWADESRVILEFADGNKVERVKSKKCNSYFLNEQEYKSFGQGVPEDIEKIVNMESINFKSQFDSPFLLSQTSGEVTKYFNSIVNLEDIDITFRNGKKEIRELNTKIPFIEEEIKEQKNELEKYSWVEDAEEEYQELEFFDKQLSEKIDTYNNLVDLEEEYEELEKDKISIDIEQAEKKYEKLKALSKQLSEKIDTYNNLVVLEDSFENLESDVVLINIEQVEKKYEKLLSYKEQYKEKWIQRQKYKLLFDDLKKCNSNLSIVTKSLQEIEKNYKKEMGDTCPLCGRKM